MIFFIIFFFFKQVFESFSQSFLENYDEFSLFCFPDQLFRKCINFLTNQNKAGQKGANAENKTSQKWNWHKKITQK